VSTFVTFNQAVISDTVRGATSEAEEISLQFKETLTEITKDRIDIRPQLFEDDGQRGFIAVVEVEGYL